jgi:2-C-methyl-D-erythritol 4-phosphate cytidylyltransferase
MKTQAIIPTAGMGTRFKTDLPKPLVDLCGKPLIVYALETFEKSRAIDSVILVGQKERLPELKGIVEQYGFKKVTQVVAGGKTRRESVSCGLDVLDHDTDIVLVHDGVRPLVSLKVIEGAVALCEKRGAVVVAVPVKPTIKRVNKKDHFVEETLDREELWEIQTPQVFKKDILLKAHQQNKDSNPTDDALMVERLGVRVKIFPGDYKNIKITTMEDLVIAETFLKYQKFTNEALH